MRIILQNLTMILFAVLLTGSLAIPHSCLDADNARVKIEQQVKVEKTAMPDHQENSKDDCCVSHHCCIAKLINPAQPIWKAAFASKVGLSITDQQSLASFDPKGLDRPPKFFA